MIIDARNKKKIAASFIFIIFVVFAIFTLAPFFFMLLSSLRPGVEMIQNGIRLNLDFTTMTFNSYKMLIEGNNGIYMTWFKNSVMITGLSIVLTLFFCSMTGYGFAAYEFKGKRLIFTLLLIVMMVPLEILILPLFELSIKLRLIDKYLGVVLPFAVSPFIVFFFRQYAAGLPKELMDSGRIDGCSEFGIYFKIMAPMMMPAFGAMSILSAMSSWNGFVWPLIVLRSSSKLTLPIGLQTLLTPYGNSYDMLLSGSVVSVVPIIILFLFNQKAFISGLTAGGVKG